MQIKKFQTANVISVSLGHMMHDIYSSFLAPILPLLIQKFSLTYSMAGFLSMCQQLPNLFNPFLGMLADRIAMRWLVIFAPAVTTITMSLIGIAPNITVVIILLLVMGISSAMFHIPTPVMIRKISGNSIGRGMSYYMFGGEIARTVGPLIILGAITMWTLEGNWRLMPFGLLASVILYYRLRNIKISEDFRKKKEGPGIWTTFRDHIPLFAVIIGMLVFRAIMRTSLTTFLPTYMESTGEGWQKGSIYLAILEISGAIGTLFWGILSDRIGRRTALIIITSISPFLMYGFVESFGVWLLVFLIMIGFFLLGTTPILLALVQDRAKSNLAFMNGMFMTINFGTAAIAVMLVGGLSDWLGMQQAFRIAAYLAPGAIPFALMLRRK